MLSDPPSARGRKEGLPSPIFTGRAGRIGGGGERWGWRGGRRGSRRRGYSLWSMFLCDPFYRAFSSGFLVASLVSHPEPGLTALPVPGTPY